MGVAASPFPGMEIFPFMQQYACQPYNNARDLLNIWILFEDLSYQGMNPMAIQAKVVKRMTAEKSPGRAGRRIKTF
jgi:hypothetical protein